MVPGVGGPRQLPSSTNKMERATRQCFRVDLLSPLPGKRIYGIPLERERFLHPIPLCQWPLNTFLTTCQPIAIMNECTRCHLHLQVNLHGRFLTGQITCQFTFEGWSNYASSYVQDHERCGVDEYASKTAPLHQQLVTKSRSAPKTETTKLYRSWHHVNWLSIDRKLQTEKM